MPADPIASIIIPAFNESESIADTITEIQRLQLNLEIIVVDDGSTDNTGTIAKNFGVHVITNPANKGYGASLKKGIKHASSETIVITDADGTYPIDMIPLLLEEFNAGNYDMVVGARTGSQVHIPLIRKTGQMAPGESGKLFSGKQDTRPQLWTESNEKGIGQSL